MANVLDARLTTLMLRDRNLVIAGIRFHHLPYTRYTTTLNNTRVSTLHPRRPSLGPLVNHFWLKPRIVIENVSSRNDGSAPEQALNTRSLQEDDRTSPRDSSGEGGGQDQHQNLFLIHHGWPLEPDPSDVVQDIV